MPYCLRDFVLRTISKFKDAEIADELNDEVDS